MIFKSDETVLYLLTDIVNLSFSSGLFPTSCKNAVVIPVLKKNGLDCEELQNFRPISNLSSISKLIERIASAWLSDRLAASSPIGIS